MRRLKETMMVCALLLSGGLGHASAEPGDSSTATIRHISVLGSGGLEVEIVASQRVTPQAQVITGPDRLIIDFPNAVPGSALRSFSVSHGEVKGVRVGLYTAHPPVTRIVLDLKGPLTYQLFPSGKTVIIKLSAGTAPSTGAQNPVVAVSPTPVVASPPPSPAPRVRVKFEGGNLTIHADKATLAEVLSEIHRSTGAEIPIPPGTDQERVVVELGPAPARDVLASLFNGSRFNFVLVGSDRDPFQLRRVMLTPKNGSAANATPVNYVPEPSQPAPVENYPGPPEIAPAPEMPADQPPPPDQPLQPQQ